MFKDTQTIENQNIPITIVPLTQKNALHMSYAEFGLLKAHEKQIAIALKVHL